MKHHPLVTANATALIVAAIYVVCAAAFFFLPGLTMAIARSWFHGVELSPLAGWNRSMGSLLIGLVTSAGAGWLVGYVFAQAYNYFLKNK